LLGLSSPLAGVGSFTYGVSLHALYEASAVASQFVLVPIY
jgi:hypothetical protein